MTVKNFLTTDVKTCTADTDLAAAATIMWDCDCGAVPVVNDQQDLIGMITDRDICIAAATRSAAPADLRVRDVMSRDVHTCAVRDDIRFALKTMGEHRVRRLPVLDDRGRLAGILSLNDLVMRADGRRGSDVVGEEFLEALKAISAREAVPA